LPRGSLEITLKVRGIFRIISLGRGALENVLEKQKFWGVSPPPLEQFWSSGLIVKTNLKQGVFSEN